MTRFITFLLAGMLTILGAGCDSKNRVVVYCAHDREFAEEILKDFEKKTGLHVETVYDTEANKSVGLYEDLVREAGRPRCDVHWNNEILATIRLQHQGIYQPYASPSSAPFPARYKAGDQTWTAFAGRARVILINTGKVAEGDRPRRLKDLALPRWKGKVVMAKPQFGTTATQAACLFQAWGEKAATDFFERLQANDIRLLPGNKNVAVEVGKGNYAVGLTDTDDAMAEVEAGNPVALLFPDDDTLLIPNTVAIVKNCPNPDGARKLVDYLLSSEVEIKLAQSPSRQIPLNPEARARARAELPQEMAGVARVKPIEVDFAEAARNWERWQSIVVKTVK